MFRRFLLALVLAMMASACAIRYTEYDTLATRASAHYEEPLSSGTLGAGVGVEAGEPADEAVRYARDLGITYPIAFDPELRPRRRLRAGGRARDRSHGCDRSSLASPRRGHARRDPKTVTVTRSRRC